MVESQSQLRFNGLFMLGSLTFKVIPLLKLETASMPSGRQRDQSLSSARDLEEKLQQDYSYIPHCKLPQSSSGSPRRQLRPVILPRTADRVAIRERFFQRYALDAVRDN